MLGGERAAQIQVGVHCQNLCGTVSRDGIMAICIGLARQPAWLSWYTLATVRSQ